MKKSTIEAVVMFIFGLGILLTSLFTYADLGVTVLGALLTFAGLLFIVFSVLDNVKEEAALDALEEVYKAKIDELKDSYETQLTKASEEAETLKGAVEEKEAELKQLKAAATNKKTTTTKKTTTKKTVINE